MIFASENFKKNSSYASGLILLAFFLSRLAYFGFLSNNPSALAPFSLEPWPVETASVQGLWIDYAKQLDAGDLKVTYDDMGVPQLLRALHKIGFGYETAFHIYLYFLLLIGGGLVWGLHRTLSITLGARTATLITLGLILYPRGIFFSRHFTIFLLPVYASLLSVLILMNDRILFQKFDGKRIAVLAGSAVLLAFFWMARSPCQVIVMALLAGLVIRGAWRSAYRRNFLIFLTSFLLFFSFLKIITPPSGHTFWHPIYRGLSNYDNRFNIDPSDDGMVALALKVNPSLQGEDVWMDPQYEQTYKKLTVDLVGSHPVWYLKLLSKRTVHLVVLPRSGGWLPRVEHGILTQPLLFRDLIHGSAALWARAYVTFYNVSVVLDLAIVFMGFIGLLLALRGRSFMAVLPYAMLLFSVLYIFILVDAHYRDVYLAGTYFYLYFALALLTDWAGQLNFQKSPKRLI